MLVSNKKENSELTDNHLFRKNLLHIGSYIFLLLHAQFGKDHKHN
jgi:hypothetical protein